MKMERVVRLMHTMILLQYCLSNCCARKLGEGYTVENRVHEIRVEGNRKDLAVNIFFRNGDLQIGKRIPLYFPVKDSSTKPPLLTREESNSIPFKSLELPYLLEFFSFSKDSSQARAMENTLKHCEFPAMSGEIKFCATSLESMLDSAVDFFGTDTPFEVLTTNYLREPSSSYTSLLQNCTVSDEPRVIWTPKMLACHTLPYPYTVFYCHSQKSDNKLFKVSLCSDNGDKIDAAAVCHMDTSNWDPKNVAFQVLKTEPGIMSPVCHFFPLDNLVWIASSSSSSSVP